MIINNLELNTKNLQGVSKKKLYGFLDFPKLFLNSEIGCLFTSFKQEISIHIAKSYRPANFCKTACPKKHLALKRFFLLIFLKLF